MKWVKKKDPIIPNAEHNVPVDHYGLTLPPHRISRNCQCRPDEIIDQYGNIIFDHKLRYKA
jgi:hypothetical protein